MKDKLIQWWDDALLYGLLWCGVRLFAYVVHEDTDKIKVIHFAKSYADFTKSVRTIVEWLDEN